MFSKSVKILSEILFNSSCRGKYRNFDSIFMLLDSTNSKSAWNGITICNTIWVNNTTEHSLSYISLSLCFSCLFRLMLIIRVQFYWILLCVYSKHLLPLVLLCVYSKHLLPLFMLCVYRKHLPPLIFTDPYFPI